MRTAKVDTEAPEEVHGRKVLDDACSQVDADVLEERPADAQDDACSQVDVEMLEESAWCGCSG